MATFVIVGKLPAAAQQERDPGADARARLHECSRAEVAVLDPDPTSVRETAPRETVSANRKVLDSEYHEIFEEIARIGRDLGTPEPPSGSLEPEVAPATAPAAAPPSVGTGDDPDPFRTRPRDGAAACAPPLGLVEDAAAAEETLNLLRRGILARAVRSAAPHDALSERSRAIALSEGALAALKCARERLMEGQFGAAGQSLRCAVDIMGELEAELAPASADQLAPGFARIYSYCRRRVMEAHLHADPTGLAEAAGLLASLREAWRLAQDQHWSVGP